MFKLLAVIVLFVFLFRSVGFILRMLMGGTFANRANSNPNFQSQRRKPSNGKLNVDHKPDPNRKKGEFKGGEYVDFEDLDK